MSKSTQNHYGEEPEIVGNFPVKVAESMFYLYLPIKMTGNFDLRIPDRLKIFEPLVYTALGKISIYSILDYYVYITAKHQFVNPAYWGNRPGWHTDGFLTDDINYIWYDCNPTIFNFSKFKITPCHVRSLDEFECQAKEENNRTYEPFNLLELNPFVVHKVAPVTFSGMRTFVKISISEHKYNLVGNSHNYLFDYEWKMFERSEIRNNPIYAEIKDSDFVPED